ncbi:MAG: ATP-NAD kinase [Halobacteriales archaeon]
MIGVVGEREMAHRAASELEAAGEPADAATIGDIAAADVELIVTVGEQALSEVAGTEPGVPVLPTELAKDTGEVDAQGLSRTIERFRAGDAELRTEPLLAVSANGEPVGHSLLDVMLVRSEPGRISEYSWTAGSECARFRADGVVLATPRGSHGYAHAAGGPRLSRDTTTVAITPVAAFGLGAAAWIEDPGTDIELCVERDEGAVSLLVDGREAQQFFGRSRVTVHRQGSLETIAGAR